MAHRPRNATYVAVVVVRAQDAGGRPGRLPMPSRSTALPRFCFWLWVCAVVPAGAASPASIPEVQQIHKCRVDGVATFQRHACAPGQAEQAWEVDVVPAERRHAARIEAIRRELQARKRALDAQRAPLHHHRHSRTRHRDGTSAPKRRARAPPGAVISMHHRPQACAAARRQREAAYARVGVKRSFALSRRTDDRVHLACR